MVAPTVVKLTSPAARLRWHRCCPAVAPFSELDVSPRKKRPWSHRIVINPSANYPSIPNSAPSRIRHLRLQPCLYLILEN